MRYSKDELDMMVVKMNLISDNFYPQATRVGNHAFIEFCGLMKKYADMCSRTAAAGHDFTQANVHTGQALVAEDHDIRYLAEKFECIFGPVLEDPTNREIFFEAMGWNNEKEKNRISSNG